MKNENIGEIGNSLPKILTYFLFEYNMRIGENRVRIKQFNEDRKGLSERRKNDENFWKGLQQ